MTTVLGRPCKLTDQMQDEFCRILRQGLYIETACDIVGIDKDTFYDWLKQGDKATEGKFHRFSDAIKRAQAEAEERLIGRLIMDDSWQSKAWILERKFRKRWGRAVAEGQEPGEAAEAIKQMLHALMGMTHGGFLPPGTVDSTQNGTSTDRLDEKQEAV